MTINQNSYRSQRVSTLVDPRTGAILRPGIGIDHYLRRLDERRANHTDLPLTVAEWNVPAWRTVT